MTDHRDPAATAARPDLPSMRIAFDVELAKLSDATRRLDAAGLDRSEVACFVPRDMIRRASDALERGDVSVAAVLLQELRDRTSSLERFSLEVGAHRRGRP